MTVSIEGAVAHLDRLLIIVLMHLKVPQLQPLRPITLMQVHKHSLFQLRLAIIDRKRVVVPVQAVDQSLDGRFLDVSDVGRGLAGLGALDDGVRVDEAEGVDDDLALDGLYRVDDDGDGAGVEGFEGLREGQDGT